MRLAKRLFLIVLVLGLAAAAGGWWIRARLAAPFRGYGADEVFVELTPGSSVAAMADQLAAAGVIPDAWTFRFAARVTGDDRRLKAGEYRFAEAATPREVLARLVAGDVYTRSVTFREGLTIAEMSEAFGRSGLGTADEFLAATADASLARAFDPSAPSLEGYLFPDTYALPRRIGAEGTVRAMLAGLDRALDADVRAAATKRDLAINDLLTIASIIEKETSHPGERALVSAVIHNRLRRGMPLQMDPTVIYALMKAGKWNGNVRRADLQMDSAYNTYRVRGLPPGPIAAPGRASIVAAVNPADVDYLYFVSRNDGTHVFASTLAEHNRNVQRWQVRYFQR